MLEINSKENEKIKLLRKLQQKKYRDKFSSFLVENLVIIKDGIEAGVVFEELYVTEEFIKKHQEEFEYLINKSKGNYFIIPKVLNKHVSQLDSASGIVARYNNVKNDIDLSGRVVYLNGINDPGNLGTIFRTGLAFGIKNFIVDENCADVYNAKTINAAKDAIFKVNILRDNDLRELKKLKEDMKIYATHVGSGNEIESCKSEEIFCLVLGSESHGVSQEILDLSDGFVRIEMSDEIESLNVAIAAGILFNRLMIV